MDSIVAKRSPPSHRHGGIKIIRKSMMALIIAVFLGYLIMWTGTCTTKYRAWFRKSSANTKSTYFGWQGGTILVYTCPILLIAVLGCVYLHLGKNLGDNKNMERIGKKHRFASWKRRPMIIRGLGIVSGIELGIFVMFITLLVWSFSANLHMFFSGAAQRSIRKGEKLWETKLDRIGLVLGLVGNICLAFLFFPVTRGSSLLPLFGLNSEASIKYHIWLGHITMLLFTAHGASYIIYWVVTHRFSELVNWNAVGVSNVAGELSLLFGLLLWATTFPRIRRNMFELFFYTHYLYILFMLFYIFHLGISYSYTILPGFYLFGVDRYLRFLQSRQRVHLISARVLSCETVELNFSKTQAQCYTPTSIIFINVPTISKLQWHPYTISSSSNLEPNKLSVIIKTEGSWTKKLYDMLSSPSPVDHLTVSVEGPYGPVSTHYLRHDKLVMVSGGSGIAPFISIIRELIYTSTTLKSKTPPILLISAFKNSSDLTILDLLLPIPCTPHQLSNLELQVEAYVTREKEPPLEKPKNLRTIWFKPNPSDAPLSPTLGPHAWLWLGAIISSSFVIFLLLMGILTRYYIYPIDHNTNEIYSHTTQSTLYMLLISVSIAMTASAAFLWNKKQNAMEAKQINESWLIDDGELESLLHQSLDKSIKVHYGGRPGLKRILFECKEPSVGVLVCGPKKMRHEVAAICSSGLAQNLHFESISFSW
ncbi:Ferric reduction oxidase [Actinidia chinensis var. chinensis]|uniref:ferric-chelate reductase (NADH) n=1 Tax=Actinidia chinensis var. chinensis TaxID=1590841 RepID=A0A2R6Q8Z5_ACTCC|nr:Ferric reduction oxidase [Actinidia chinensis var. chinensis]